MGSKTVLICEKKFLLLSSHHLCELKHKINNKKKSKQMSPFNLAPDQIFAKSQQAISAAFIHIQLNPLKTVYIWFVK
jgi:hypothetical protein